MKLDEDVGEFGPHFEGDILLTEDQEQYIISLDKKIPLDYYKWENGKVPYEFQKEDFS